MPLDDQAGWLELARVQRHEREVRRNGPAAPFVPTSVLLTAAGPRLRPRGPVSTRARRKARCPRAGHCAPGGGRYPLAGARPTRDDRSLSDPRPRHLAHADTTFRGGTSRGLATRKPTLLFSLVGLLSFRFDAARLFGLLLKLPPRRPRFEPLCLLVPRLQHPGSGSASYRRPSTARRRSLLLACCAWTTHERTLWLSASASAPWRSTSQRRRR